MKMEDRRKDKRRFKFMRKWIGRRKKILKIKLENGFKEERRKKKGEMN